MEIIFEKSVEASVLGTAFFDKECCLNALNVLKPESFYFPEHQMIFSAMKQVYHTGSIPTIESVRNYLKVNDLMKIVGNSLVELKYQGSLMDFEFNLKVILDQKFKKDFLYVVKDITTNKDFSKVSVDRIFELVDGLRSGGNSLNFATLEEVSRNLSEGKGYAAWLQKQQEDFRDGKATMGYATGFPVLDGWIGGLEPGTYHCIAAEPGGGKTSFACQVILNLIKQGIKCCIFSLEITNENLLHKLISIVTGINVKRIKKGDLNGIEFQNVTFTERELSGNPNLILSTESIDSLNALKCYLMRAHDAGCKVVMIDYLQQIRHRGENASEGIKEVSQTIQQLLLKYKMTGIILSQFGKDSAKQGLTSDRLFGSSQLRKDATTIMLLDPDFASKTTSLKIDKDRDGGASGNTVKFRFIETYFEEFKPFTGHQIYE